MHLDPAVVVVEHGKVAERAEIECRVELTIEPRQQVEVESRRNSRRVVVGGMEDRGILATINAEYQRSARTNRGANAMQECRRLGGMQVPDRGSGEKRHPSRVVRQWRQRKPSRV